MTARPLLELRSLSLSLGSGAARIPILVDASFAIDRSEIVGLVGESGSGKTMAARAITASLPRQAHVRGEILLDGEDMLRMTPARLREIRARTVGVIFQDPRSAVDPLWTVEDHITEGMRVHGGLDRATARERAVQLLSRTGISDGHRRLGQYSHQLSGGMLQRVVIAGALAGDPALIIADEPTTALDVTTQAEIVAIFAALRRDRGLAMLFITHDLGLAAALCDRVLVMYAGRIVEEQPSGTVFARPAHPYTAGLVAARPSIARRRNRLSVIPGHPTSALAAGAGCPFHPRCRFAADSCRTTEPRLENVDGALTACLRIDQIREELRVRDDAA